MFGRALKSVVAAVAICGIFSSLAFADPTRGWQYETSTDKLSGKESKTATIRSDNSLSLAFPYEGVNYGRLIVRQHPQYGLDVIVAVSKGQIMCYSYDRCTQKIRFDDGGVEKLTVLAAADNSADVVFFAYPKWAIGKLKNAKEIVIQLTMYQAGNQTLVFTADKPLDW